MAFDVGEHVLVAQRAGQPLGVAQGAVGAFDVGLSHVRHAEKRERVALEALVVELARALERVEVDADRFVDATALKHELAEMDPRLHGAFVVADRLADLERGGEARFGRVVAPEVELDVADRVERGRLRAPVARLLADLERFAGRAQRGSSSPRMRWICAMSSWLLATPR